MMVPLPQLIPARSNFDRLQQGLGILQSALVQLSIDHGLGKKMRVVSTNDLTSFDKVTIHSDRTGVCEGD